MAYFSAYECQIIGDVRVLIAYSIDIDLPTISKCKQIPSFSLGMIAHVQPVNIRPSLSSHAAWVWSYTADFTPFHIQDNPHLHVHKQQIKRTEISIVQLYISDPLSENPALPANIEFELEAILSIQVFCQLNSDYCTKVLQGAALYHAELWSPAVLL